MPARKYPWEEWFSKPRTVLKRGVDYKGSQSTMYQMIRNNASMRKIRVCITDTADGMIIDVSKVYPGETRDEFQHTDSAPVSG